MKYEGKAASTETSSLVLPIRSHSEYFPGTQRSGYGLQWICCSVSSLGGNLAALGHLGQHTQARYCALSWPLQLPWHLTPGVDFIPWSFYFLLSQAEPPLTKDALPVAPASHAAFLMPTPTCITHSHLLTSWPEHSRVQLLYGFRTLLQIKKTLRSSGT